MILNSIENAETVNRSYGLIKILAAKNSKKAVSTNADLILIKIAASKETSKHYHLKSEEIFYVMEGRVTLLSDEGHLKLKKGDLVLIRPKEIHCFKNDGKNPCVMLLVESPPYEEDDKFYI